MPNGQVLRVGNRSQLWAIALLDVAIDPQADVDRASEVLREVATNVAESVDFAADVLEPPEVLGVENLTSEGMTVRLRVKTKPGGQLRLQRVLRSEIKEALEREGIALAHHARRDQPESSTVAGIIGLSVP